MRESELWIRLRQFFLENPGRFAGGSAVSDPLGLLALEEERLATLQRSAHASSVVVSGLGPPVLHDRQV
jgi:hypothetical protein